MCEIWRNGNQNGQVNHARNVWDRAVTVLPRVNQFWYKYMYMEEMLGIGAGARQVLRGGWSGNQKSRLGCLT